MGERKRSSDSRIKLILIFYNANAEGDRELHFLGRTGEERVLAKYHARCNVLIVMFLKRHNIIISIVKTSDCAICCHINQLKSTSINQIPAVSFSMSIEVVYNV